WFLCREFAFDGQRLVQAVCATFKRRATAVPHDVPTGLTESFATDATKQTQWRAFLRRSRVTGEEHTLQAVAATISPFVLPVLQAANMDGAKVSSWPPGGPWS
ncbi:MAG: nucleotidyl transferase AbiEii/AbiGii toxin family protein, partial [Myxococcota bacterium]